MMKANEIPEWESGEYFFRAVMNDIPILRDISVHSREIIAWNGNSSSEAMAMRLFASGLFVTCDGT